MVPGRARATCGRASPAEARAETTSRRHALRSDGASRARSSSRPDASSRHSDARTGRARCRGQASRLGPGASFAGSPRRRGAAGAGSAGTPDRSRRAGRGRTPSRARSARGAPSGSRRRAPPAPGRLRPRLAAAGSRGGRSAAVVSAPSRRCGGPARDRGRRTRSARAAADPRDTGRSGTARPAACPRPHAGRRAGPHDVQERPHRRPGAGATAPRAVRELASAGCRRGARTRWRPGSPATPRPPRGGAGAQRQQGQERDQDRGQGRPVRRSRDTPSG